MSSDENYSDYNYDNNIDFIHFNEEENTLFGEEYLNDGIFGSQTYMQPNDERLLFPPNIEDDSNQKCKSELAKSLVKTAPTTGPRVLLNKKREKEEEKGEEKKEEKKEEKGEEKEEEKEEDKEPKSDKEKASEKKVDIFKISKEKNRDVSKGRKKKYKNPGKHNKFCLDNIMRRIKTNLFDTLLRFINASIKEEEIEICEKNIKKKISITPILLKPTQEIIRSINIEFNLNLLEAKLKTIFSQDTSKKVENYGLDKNKKLIEKIYNEKKQKKTIEILNMTLNQCLEQINGRKTYKELEGLENEFKKVIENLKKIESEEYVSQFVELVNSYREYFDDKKPRQTKNNFKLKKNDN